MSKDQPEDTQKTQPKKGEPITIPVPSESQIMRDFEKIATSPKDDDQTETEEES